MKAIYYRKIPVNVQAVQWTGGNETVVMDFVGKGRLKFSGVPQRFEHDHEVTNDMVTITIPSREGDLVADRYDWIIKGYTKEAGFHCWVCKPDYFKTAYEEGDQSIDWFALYEVQEDAKANPKKETPAEYRHGG